MKLTKKISLSLLLLAMATSIVFSVTSTLYASACPADPWRTYSNARGETWTGTILITYEPLAKNEKPDMPGYATPLDLPGYTDIIVKISFYLRLYNRSGRDVMTFSCSPGRDNDGYTSFWLLGDYCDRQGEAVHNFLRTKVYPVLCGGECTGALKSVVDEGGNTEYQASNGYDDSSPLHHSAEITIIAPCSNCGP